MAEYRVTTFCPVALDSRDHTQPGGTKNDNSTNLNFNRRLYEVLPSPRPLRILDLGCAGGGAVKTFLDDGQEAVGIEGSDYSLLRKRAEWATIPANLFTADITRTFAVSVKNEQGEWRGAKFDAVTAWEVMEHLAEDRLPVLCANVREHLAPGGIWVMSVSTQHGDHHVCLHPREWWLEMFDREGFVERPDLRARFGEDDWVRGPLRGAPESFHLILSKKGVS
jgi:2-polyprenyl-3-methyl-5-hydroxy-6-metoxy-1,4-benzoquinol methylase